MMLRFKNKCILAFLAFCLWGGWAYFINDASTITTRVLSSILQGVFSFLITILMVHAVSSIYHRLPNKKFRVLMPAIITVSFTGIVIAIMHYLIGTASILQTIAPPLTVAFIFCLFTTFHIHKEGS